MKPILIVLMLAGVAAADPPGDPAPAKHTPAELRQTCADAMNADPTFAKSIVDSVDKQIDQKTIDAHNDAFHHIQKNERHVLIAYIAMWLVAAAFVVFLWRRQQGLVAQIDQLRRDLAHAAKEAK